MDRYPVLYCDFLAGRTRHARIRWQITGDQTARRAALRDIDDAKAIFSHSGYPWLHQRLEAEAPLLEAASAIDQTAR